MKKILSLFALLMTIVIGAKAADADRVFALSDFTKDGSNYSWKAGTELLNKNKVTWVEVPSADANGTIAFYGSSNKDRYLYIYKTNGTVKDESRPILMTGNKTADGTINYTSDDILTDNEKYYLVFSTADDFKAKNIDYTVAAATDKPTIETQPVGATYQVNETPAALTVEATASAGNLTYTWYSNTTGVANPNSDIVIDAGSATLSASNIPTDEVGTTYYYVVVGDDNGTVTSQLAAITVVTEEAPQVSASISKAAVRIGESVTLTANVTAGVPAPTLQWYSCDDSEGTNAVAIDGATSSTYQPSTATIGTFYFLVEASNYVAANVASNVVTLKVADKGVAGEVGDLVAVSEGYVFVADKVTADGTLKPDANYVYDDGKVFIPAALTVANNKGSNTFGGASHFNSLRLKNTSDYIAFKVADACAITFYVENPDKNPARNFKVGNAPDDDTYGIIPDGQISATLLIPSATTVYVTGTGGDRYLGGFEVKGTTENITIDESGVATYVTSSALDFSSQNGAFKAYVVTGLNAAKTSAQTAEVTQVPAGTALLLKGAAGSYDVEVIESAEAVTNMLLASDGTVTGADDVFAYSKSAKQFKKVATTVTIPAGKAYLQIANAGDALDINFDGETAVEAIAEANEAAEAPVKVVKNGKLFIGNFNVAGQQVK